jgi:hypothetical protein
MEEVNDVIANSPISLQPLEEEPASDTQKGESVEATTTAGAKRLSPLPQLPCPG